MQRNRGYIGLIALLISFAIMALVVWRTDLFEASDGPQSDESIDGEPKSIIERNLEAVQSAKDAKALLEHRNTEQMKGL